MVSARLKSNICKLLVLREIYQQSQNSAIEAWSRRKLKDHNKTLNYGVKALKISLNLVFDEVENINTQYDEPIILGGCECIFNRMY